MPLKKQVRQSQTKTRTKLSSKGKGIAKNPPTYGISNIDQADPGSLTGSLSIQRTRKGKGKGKAPARPPIPADPGDLRANKTQPPTISPPSVEGVRDPRNRKLLQNAIEGPTHNYGSAPPLPPTHEYGAVTSLGGSSSVDLTQVPMDIESSGA